MKDCPVVNIRGCGNSSIRLEETPTGWYFYAPEGLSGRIGCFDDSVICRILPERNTDIVQLGIGKATSSLCNAVYSPSADTAIMMKADNLKLDPVTDDQGRVNIRVSCTGPLTVTLYENYIAKHCNQSWYRAMDRSVFKRPPAGWCSWYYYYLGITEEEVVKNTDWLEKNLKKFGCEWVQIDDGWQGRGDGFGDNRNWFETCERDFPHGMKWIADYIRSKGLRPGIWCIPFTQSDSDRFENEPGLFVHRPDGTSPGVRNEKYPDDRRHEWAGMYHLDATSDKARDYLKRLFEMICNEWGYEYVKIDGTTHVMPVHDKYRTNLADPSMNGDRAFRRGLEVIKSVMGKERFLLNCAAEGPWTSFGFAEGLRTGGDVGLSWEGMLSGIKCTMKWLYLNTYGLYTDPDVVCVRQPLPYDLAKMWVTLLGITGQLLMASDKMYELPEERVELLRRIYPVADIHPMELYPIDSDHMPAIFDLKVDLPHVGKWDVAALFNWTGNGAGWNLTPGKLGLEGESWICTDAWTGDLLHYGNGEMYVSVPPYTCRVVTYWKDLKRPQFVGTNRHLTQGAEDVEEIRWDGEKLELSGRSRLVGGDPYKIRIFVPEGYRAAQEGVQMKGQIATVTINREENETVDWKVAFELK